MFCALSEAKGMNIIMKKIVGTVALAAVFLIVGVVVTKLFYTTISPRDVFVKDINFSNNQVALTGTILSSAIKYKGYDVQYKNGALYIKIKGGLISFSKPEDINILVSSNNEIREIYLEDDTSSENILIWPKK